MSRQVNFKRVISDCTVHGCSFEPRRKDVVQEHLSIERVLSDLREMLKPTPLQIAEATGVDIDTIRKLQHEAPLPEQGILDKSGCATRAGDPTRERNDDV